MKSSLRLVLLGGGAAFFASAAVMAACSSEDTTVDVRTEAGAETSTPEAGSETSTDAGKDAPFDGGFTPQNFDTLLATELCNSLARCCYGTTTPADGGVDGGSFDRAACETAYGKIGFEGSNAGNELKDGGKVTVDQVAADDCINKVKAMNCNLPGTEFKTIRAACFAAYAGTGAANAPCTQSIECQKGLFCKRDADGGPGTCQTIRPVDGPCGDYDPIAPDEACSYRGGGTPGNYCKIYDYDTSTDIPQNQWKCTAAANSGKCGTSLWCDETICNFDGNCVSPDKYWDPACTFFVK